MKRINREQIEKTNSLEEAIIDLFGLFIDGRTCVLKSEAMEGDVANEYDSFGRNVRPETYKRIVSDFKNRAGCYGINHLGNHLNVGSILDVGCGSGLLTLELAENTNGNIIGLDLSKDMISLAKDNLEIRSQEKIREIKQFWRKLPKSCKPHVDDYKKLQKFPPLLSRIKLFCGNVYDLEHLGLQGINYIICRNVLHRFQNPQNAINQMYNVLSPNGKIYLRDIKRDADWKTIVKRIGKNRWSSQTLVKDYIGAMAGMFTKKELRSLLSQMNLGDFEITDGEYYEADIKQLKKQIQLNEYETKVEYVCIIKKHL